MSTKEHFAVAHEECFNAIQLKMSPRDIAKRAEALAHYARILELESRVAPDGVVGNRYIGPEPVDPLIRAMDNFKPLKV